jgi:molybdopterin-binding protein
MSKYILPAADQEFTKFIGVGHELCTVGYCVDEDVITDIRVTNADGFEVSSYMSDSDWNDLELECYTHQYAIEKANMESV